MGGVCSSGAGVLLYIVCSEVMAFGQRPKTSSAGKQGGQKAMVQQVSWKPEAKHGKDFGFDSGRSWPGSEQRTDLSHGMLAAELRIDHKAQIEVDE